MRHLQDYNNYEKEWRNDLHNVDILRGAMSIHRDNNFNPFKHVKTWKKIHDSKSGQAVKFGQNRNTKLTSDLQEVWKWALGHILTFQVMTELGAGAWPWS